VVRRFGFLILVSIFFVGCGNPKAETDKLPKPAETSPSVGSNGWVLTTTEAAGETPALLWNGLIGVRIGRTGGGLDYEGKPLGFYMIDEYQKDGEEKILSMPNPILVTWTLGNELFNAQNKDTHNFLKSGGTPLDPRQGHDYSQSLDMRSGILTTGWKQTVDGTEATILCETAVHPFERVLAQRWTLKCSKPTPFSIKTLDYSGPNDVQESLGTDSAGTVSLSASASRVVAMSTRMDSGSPGALSRAGGFRIQEGLTSANKPTLYDRVLSFGAHGAQPLPRFTAANMSDLKAQTPKLYNFDEVASASRKAWDERWKTDIEIDGPAEDQLAIRSFLFYLRSSINPAAKRSISPFGLSDDKYWGHVFWDSDMWVFPALSLLDPKEAASISNYRLAKASQAIINFRDWFRLGCPTAFGPRRAIPAKGGDFTPAGAKFPWESSETGRETCLGPTRFEEGITGSVIWGLTQSADLGLVPQSAASGLAAMASNTYVSMATPPPGSGPGSQGPFSIKSVICSDESAIVDNDLFTNLLAEWLANGRRWATPAHPSFVIPKDDKSLVTYKDDPVMAYRQASAVLSIFPLQYPLADSEARVMMNRFPPKVAPDGPAMNNSLNALIWARIDDPRAYDAWKASWQPFTQHPLLLFSEKAVRTPTYFTTGAAGSLLSVLYGFAGIRIDLKSPGDAVWSHQILGGSVLSVNPHLPSQWKSVKLKNFSILGSTYTLTATHTGCTVIKGV
jgi:hypothetical protein